METAATSIDADIFSAVIAPEQADMEPAAAESILKLGFNERQKQRMGELAEKNNQGNITEGELDELHSYLRVGNFLNLFKAKARNSLNHRPA